MRKTIINYKKKLEEQRNYFNHTVSINDQKNILFSIENIFQDEIIDLVIWSNIQKNKKNAQR